MQFRKRTLTERLKEVVHSALYVEDGGVQTRKELYRQLGDQIQDWQKEDYLKAWDELQAGIFLQNNHRLVQEYHAGDDLLTVELLRGALRTVYSSKAALLHFAFTGVSGSGKSDLIATVSALLPSEMVVPYTSITPKDLYYSLREKTSSGYVMNPDKYRNKLITITEINDSKDWMAVKAFAEMDEYRTEKHATTLGGKSVELEIRGPRALWITSVKAVGDEQIRRRFINSEITSNSDEDRQRKAETITRNILNQATVDDDPRTRIAQAGYNLLYASQPEFTPVDNETAVLLEGLILALAENGYSPTQLKQLYSLAECAAVEKQFARGICQVQTEDVLEAWYLLGFEGDHEIEVGGQWLEPLSPLRTKEEMGPIPIKV